MILQLLISSAVLNLALARACPENAGCLYCITCRRKTADMSKILVTMNATAFEEFRSKDCGGNSPDTLKLVVEPLDEPGYEWKFTVSPSSIPTDRTMSIIIGDLLKISVRDTGAKYLYEEDKITYKKNGTDLVFTLVELNLFERFNRAEIGFYDGFSTAYNNFAAFWKKLSPCDNRLIKDSCKDENCTKLVTTVKNTITCPAEQSLWMNSGASWIKLTSITCDTAKNWVLTDESKQIHKVIEDLPTIQCSDKEPKSPASPTTKSSVTPSRVTLSTTPNFGASVLPTFIFPILLFALRI